MKTVILKRQVKCITTSYGLTVNVAIMLGYKMAAPFNVLAYDHWGANASV